MRYRARNPDAGKPGKQSERHGSAGLPSCNQASGKNTLHIRFARTILDALHTYAKRFE